MARKGRARRFREARQLKQGYDDGLFAEGSGTLADAPESDDSDNAADSSAATDEWDDEGDGEDEEDDEGYDWDPDREG